MKYSFDEFFNYLPEDIQIKLEKTIQDAKHHAEGCVKNHIKMIFEYIQDNYNEDLDLLICAMFHDLGKIDTTKVFEKKDGIRIHAIGHEDYAQSYINLYKLYFASLENYDSIDWNKVSYICKNHMRAHMYYSGRISKPAKRQAMEEHEYFEDLMRFERADENGSIHGETQRFVIVALGIPGAGKTTWRRKFIEEHKDQNWKVICPDDMREAITGSISNITQDSKVWTHVYGKLDDILYNTNDSIIFDSTAVNIKTQKQIEYICNTYKVAIIYKIFECDKDDAVLRIATDLANDVNRSNVPNEIVWKMSKSFVDAKDRVIQEASLRNVWILHEEKRSKKYAKIFQTSY